MATGNNNSNQMTNSLTTMDPIQSTIYHTLNHSPTPTDAIFLAERWLQMSLSEESYPTRLYTLATCYYKTGNKLQAYEVLTKTTRRENLNYRCRYLLALVSEEIGRLPMAEQTLLSYYYQTPSSSRPLSVLDSIEHNFLDLAPFALQLYGRICTQTERHQVAIEAKERLIKLNPFLFSAWEEYSNEDTRSVEKQVEKVFQISHLSDPQISQYIMGVNNNCNSNKEEVTLMKKPISNILMNKNSNSSTRNSNFLASTPNSQSTVTSNEDADDSSLSPIATTDSNLEQPQQPKPKKPCLRANPSSSQQQQPSSQIQQVRRSSRLFGNQQQQSLTILKENEVVLTTTKQKKVKTSMRKELEQLLATIRPLALGTAYLSKYELERAIETMETTPESADSLAILARAQFELGDYEKAIETFETLRNYNPSCTLPAFAYYSSSLWHLSMETALSSLSQELLSLNDPNRTNPVTWITLGNTFSLQKEHEAAIKFLNRAVLCAKKFPNMTKLQAYAYVLCGHEYVNADELDKAMRCFRESGRCNKAQYNCWYGIGMINYKQEKYAEAEFYYRKAVEETGGKKGVLLCHLGVVQSALQKHCLSLATFDRALALNPNDPLVKFHRASVLFASNKLEEALEELEELRKLVPKESLVHFLIAKIHSRLGSTHQALLHFSWATDLDPKGANNHIKESIEPVLNGNNNEQGGNSVGGQDVVMEN